MKNSSDSQIDDASETVELVGSVLDGRYKVLEPLGNGGMGAVYRAEHIMLGSEVAIKILHPRFAYDPEWVRRFLLEARAASKIRHPHIVQMLDFAAARRGQVYMAMELLVGESLAELARREGPLPWPRVAHITEQIVSALEAAHAQGIVHRDIKLGNCFRTTRNGDPDHIKVLDFGIAKFLAGDGDDAEMPSTASGLIMGTPEYMAPEILQGARPDPRVDVYAVGVLMYKLVTGRVPFSGNHIAIVQQMLQRDAKPPSAVAPPGNDISPEVDSLILAALQKDPAARTANMTELLEALRGSGDDARTSLHSRPVVATPSVRTSSTAEPPTVRRPTLPPADAERPEASTDPHQNASSAGKLAAPTEPGLKAVMARPSPTAPQRGAIRRTLGSLGMTIALLTAGLVLWRNIPSSSPRPGPSEAEPQPSEQPARPAHEPIVAAHGATPVGPSARLDDEAVAEPVPTGDPGGASAGATANEANSDASSAKASGAATKPAKASPTKRLSSAKKTSTSPLERVPESTFKASMESLKSDIQTKCFAKSNVVAGTAVTVDVSISPDGIPVGVPSKARGIPFVACIVERVTMLRFPKTKTGGAGKYTYIAAG